jgi:hypothetical protein
MWVLKYIKHYKVPYMKFILYIICYGIPRQYVL